MIARIAEQLVALALAWPRRAIAASLLIAIISAVYLVSAFTVRTDMDSLMSKDLPWRKSEQALKQAFVSQGDDIALVIDGKTPEQADHVANQLMEKLAAQPKLFALALRPDGGPFLEKSALLFLPLDEVKSTTKSLIDAQPLLGPVASDPTLHGVMGAVKSSLMDAEHDPTRFDRLKPVFAGMDAALAQVEKGQPANLSWRLLVSGETAGPHDLQRIVNLTPKLDYNQLDPTAPAEAAITRAISEIGIKPGAAGQPNVRITGTVAMESDELANLAEATGPIAIGSLIAMLVILYFGVRSWPVIGAIAMTVVSGLAVTAAGGLLMFQRFTLVSVAFLPLFVGLGIDFAIQFAVRYRAETGIAPDRDLALLATGRTAGPGVALAAAATGFGFFAFWPTPYKGVSELGLIAGFGMIVGALFALTLLPAWLKVLKAGEASEEEGLERLAGLYGAAEARRKLVLGVAGIAALAALVVFPLLRFDFDPISLRSRKDVSVSTFLELTRNPDLTPNRLQALAPSREAANNQAAKLRQLPQVAAVYTIDSLIPTDQEAKLAVIRDAALILDTTLNPFDLSPPASDEETKAAMLEAAAELTRLATGPSASQQAARTLAQRLSRIANGSAALREAAAHALTDSLTPALDQVRASLTAEEVTLDTLPTPLREDWLTKSGQARIDITPKGDPADTANLAKFVKAVRTIAPNVSGPPVTVQEAGGTILNAFIEAGILSTVAIGLLLFAILRRVRDVALTIAPVLLTFILTIGTLAITGQAINLENLIALPLLLGIGVSFNIYSVIAWRDGANSRTRASLSHAILFSALTTGASFAALAFSAHPGTASLGRLLLICMVWTLAGALFLQPALLAAMGRPKA